jgi:hypothetical protein
MERGIRVIIAGAGHAAHLAGAMSAYTILPIIGIPIDSSCLKGLDSLLSTVQMPPGIPVATVSIGKPGAKMRAFLPCKFSHFRMLRFKASFWITNNSLPVKLKKKPRKLNPSSKIRFINPEISGPSEFLRKLRKLFAGRNRHFSHALPLWIGGGCPESGGYFQDFQDKKPSISQAASCSDKKPGSS